MFVPRAQGIELWKIAKMRGGAKNFSGVAFRLMDVISNRVASQVKNTVRGL